MILQSFANPVWTVTEVGGVYVVLIVAAAFAIYYLSSSFIQAIGDIIRFFRK